MQRLVELAIVTLSGRGIAPRWRRASVIHVAAAHRKQGQNHALLKK